MTRREICKTADVPVNSIKQYGDICIVNAGDRFFACQAARRRVSCSGVSPDRSSALRSAGRVSCQASVSRIVSVRGRERSPCSAERSIEVSDAPASPPRS